MGEPDSGSSDPTDPSFYCGQTPRSSPFYPEKRPSRGEHRNIPPFFPQTHTHNTRTHTQPTHTPTDRNLTRNRTFIDSTLNKSHVSFIHSVPLLTLPIADNMAASLGPKKGEITYAESFVCFTSLTLNYCAKHTESRGKWSESRVTTYVKAGAWVAPASSLAFSPVFNHILVLVWG